MRHGSLFSGYGGLDLAIADVFGAETAWVSDVDPGANRILAHRYPDAPNLGDITRVDWETVEPVDIISGGSPCQDLSHAGRRAGMTEGTRSNLWVSMREAIATIRPTWVVWENVRGAMSADADSALEHCPGCMGDARDRGPVLRALGRVLGDLSDLGFDAQWHGLRAADVGACHGRFRVFVLAYANDARSQGQPHPTGAAPAQRHGHALAGAGRPDLTLLPTPVAQPSGNSPEVHLRKKPGREIVTDLAIIVENGLLASGGRLLPTPTTTQRGTDANLDTREGARANLHNEVAKLLPTPRATDGTKGGPNQRGSSGDLMLPSAVVQLTGKELCSSGSGGASAASSSTNTSGPSGGPAAVTAAGGSTSPRWGDYAAALARHEQAFGRPAPDPTEHGPKGNPRLSAAFVEWMMALPAGWVTDVPGVTRNQALKALGNGVVPAQAAAALRLMLARMEVAA